MIEFLLFAIIMAGVAYAAASFEVLIAYTEYKDAIQIWGKLDAAKVQRRRVAVRMSMQRWPWAPILYPLRGLNAFLAFLLDLQRASRP